MDLDHVQPFNKRGSGDASEMTPRLHDTSHESLNKEVVTSPGWEVAGLSPYSLLKPGDYHGVAGNTPSGPPLSGNENVELLPLRRAEYEGDSVLDSVQPSDDLVWRNSDTTTIWQDGHPVTRMNEEGVDLARYWPLLKATQTKDWKSVENFVEKYPQTLTVKISETKKTILHLLIRLDAPISLLEKFMDISESLHGSRKGAVSLFDLFSAAINGNTKAAMAFVRRDNDLPNTADDEGYLAIHVAAMHGHKETVQYLRKVTSRSLDDKRGVELLGNLINCGLYGIAFDLLKQYPKLARERTEDTGYILAMLANKPLAFESGSRLGLLERLIYHCIPVREEPDVRAGSVGGDVENPSDIPHIPTSIGTLLQKLNIMFWNVLMQLAPIIKHISETKLTHMQTHEIVRMMCGEVFWNRETSKLLRTPMLMAATLGTYEIVSEIMNAYFYAFRFEEGGYDFVHLAILHRQEKVFGLAKDYVWAFPIPNLAIKGANILHSAGRVMPSSQVSGAALQMQKEIQWFKAVENTFHPSFQEQQNHEGKTPRQVFSEGHKDLVKDGEQWMKDTAQSCSVVAALIITVVFTAAFTVPGGNDSKGIPNFLHQPTFVIFAISDAFALFFSTTSVLMFLGILTSRYAEEDFLESLPKKLIIGLITLFVSIASLMIAFGTAIYMVLSNLWPAVYIPIAILGGLTVIIFAKLQFPLLIEMYLSTYRSTLYQPKKRLV